MHAHSENSKEPDPPQQHLNSKTMSDGVMDKIVDAIKEAAQDVGDAVKKALHIPDNIAPLMATLTELTATGAKFAQGEGSAEAAAGVVDKLKQLSKHVDGMEEGPLRKMVMGLKNEAVGKLQGVSGPGVDKILAILTIIGTSESGKVDEIAASAPTPAAATPAAPEATPAAPSTAPAVPEPAAPAEPVAVVAAEST